MQRFMGLALLSFLLGLVSLGSAADWELQNPFPPALDLWDVCAVGERLWAVGDAGLVMHSTDGGQNWAARTYLDGYALRAVTFLNADTGWTATERQLFKTTDGGVRWALQCSTASGQAFQTLIITGAQTGWALIAMGNDQGEIRHTADGGVTWETRLAPDAWNLRGVAFASDSCGWAITHSPLVFRTTDGGLSWQSANLPVAASCEQKTLAFIDDQTGWINGVVPGEAGFVCRTQDGGQTWSLLDSTFSDPWTREMIFADADRGWLVAGDPDSGTHGQITSTTDGGVHWTVCLITADFAGLGAAVTPAGHAVAVGTTGFLVRPQDNECDWEAVTGNGPTVALSGIDFVSATHGWVVGANGAVWRTTNGGLQWQPQNSGESTLLSAVDVLDGGQFGWIAGAGGLILRTTDGGTWWDPQISYTQEALADIQFVSATTGWAVGGNGTILHTTSGGVNWEAQVSGTAFHLQAVSFVNELTGWAVGANLTYPDCGVVLGTTDGGAHWGVLEGGDPDTAYMLAAFDVTFVDAQEGWLACGQYYLDPPMPRGTVMHTTDGGVTWAVALSSAQVQMISIAADPRGTVWAGGSSGQLWHQSAGGGWATDTLPATSPIFGFSFPDANYGWAAGGSGMILRYSAAPSAVPPRPRLLPAAYTLAAYPNPFNPSTRLEFDLPRAGHATLAVYDVTGRQVAVLVDETLTAGHHARTFDGSGLASGLYFARLQSGALQHTQKLVLLK